jgi:hypothetical protein
VFPVDLGSGAFSGRFTALGGTGGLTDLHGQGTFEGTGTIGTYSLQITFAPCSEELSEAQAGLCSVSLRMKRPPPSESRPALFG